MVTNFFLLDHIAKIAGNVSVCKNAYLNTAVFILV